MPGTAIRLGPFTSLNTASDPTAIADSEMTECNNLIRDVDGSLTMRPPIQTTVAPAGLTQRLLIIGTAVFDTGANPGTYLFGSNSSGVYYLYNGTWFLIPGSAGFNASSMVQFAGLAVFLSQPNNGGNVMASWSNAVPWAAINPATLITMMDPANTNRGGAKLVVYKNRVWIIPGPDKAINSSTLIYSDRGNPAGYASTAQSENIRPGDGQHLMDAIVYQDQLLLFKNDSTFATSISSIVAGALQLEVVSVNNVIGATTSNCVVQHENIVYVYHEGIVYALSGYVYRSITDKLTLNYDPSAPSTRLEPIFLSLFGNKIIFRYFNTIYCYETRLQTWSTWTSASVDLQNFGPLTQLPTSAIQATAIEYYAGSSCTGTFKVFLIKDGFSAADMERDAVVPANYPITCSIRTKNFDLATSHQYKKLNHWGVDLVAASAVIGSVTPIVIGFASTWGLLFSSGLTWAGLGTWANPITNPSVTTQVAAASGTVLRRFIRLPKALRFRQANFRVEFSGSGSTADGPCKLFSVTLFTSARQLVEKASN